MKSNPLIPGFVILLLLVAMVSAPNIFGEVKDYVNSIIGLAVGEPPTLDSSQYVPGEIIVKIKEDLLQRSPDGNGEVLERVEGIITAPVNQVRSVFSENVLHDPQAVLQGLDKIYLINVNTNQDLFELIRELESDPGVEYAEVNQIGNLTDPIEPPPASPFDGGHPNDPGFHTNFPLYCQWALHNDDELCMAPSADPDVDIDAPEAWDITIGDSSIIIALLDSGVDLDHPDLEGNIQPGGYDFAGTAGPIPVPDNDPNDGYGHGTKMAGIMAAVTNNGIGIAGVCPNCKILPEKVSYDDGTGITVDLVADAIYHAKDQEVDIISMSLVFEGPSSTLEYAINNAHNNGIVLVAAAGNNNAEDMDYPCAYNNVLCVAATTFTDEREPSSNYGDWIDVAAPGYEIYTTVKDGGYNWVGQTSAATAFVAGEAGLLRSQVPGLPKSEVERKIIDYVDPVYSTGIGSGRINLEKALSSPVTCGSYIMEDTVLTEDILNCDATNILTIGADDVILDCGGHILEGDGISNSRGIYSQGKSGITIKNCEIRSSLSQGIYLSLGNSNLISSNDVYQVGGDAIIISSSMFNVIDDNQIYSNGDEGIYISGASAAGNNITNNDIYSNTGAGVWVANSAFSNNIIANTIHDNNGGIIFDNTNFNIIKSNTIYSDVYGINLIYSISNGINKNTIYSNTGYGIRIGPQSNSNVIKQNNVYDNGLDAISLYKSDSNSIIGNTFRYSGEYGADLDVGSESNVFYDNTFTGNVLGDALEDATSITNGWNLGYKGNWWTDATRGTPYEIPGDGDGVDNYPNRKVGTSTGGSPLVMKKIATMQIPQNTNPSYSNVGGGSNLLINRTFSVRLARI